jgi:hypothetical protein
MILSQDLFEGGVLTDLGAADLRLAVGLLVEVRDGQIASIDFDGINLPGWASVMTSPMPIFWWSSPLEKNAKTIAITATRINR